MALKVIGDRVLIKQDPEEESKHGILLPDSAKEKPQRGTVIAVGEGRRLDNGKLVAPPVAVGDRVIYSKYGGTEVRDGDEEYIVLNSSDIYAKNA
ncbi:MAG: co-chaperone GroES [Candidatus Zipacnadales bacterium]